MITSGRPVNRVDPGRQLAAVVQDRPELAIAEAVGVGLSHPIIQGVWQIGSGFAALACLGGQAVVALAGSPPRKIPAALHTSGTFVRQNGDFTRLASPPLLLF